MPEPFDVVIYHNPACGTSRNTLAMIRNAGIEPHVVEYLKTPPNRTLVKRMLARAASPFGSAARERHALRRARPRGSGADRRPAPRCRRGASGAVEPAARVSPKGVRLCRPSEAVLDLLPGQQGEFVKEDGERVVDEQGRRVATA